VAHSKRDFANDMWSLVTTGVSQGMLRWKNDMVTNASFPSLELITKGFPTDHYRREKAQDAVSFIGEI
jgi:hypothetical protein